MTDNAYQYHLEWEVDFADDGDFVRDKNHKIILKDLRLVHDETGEVV